MFKLLIFLRYSVASFALIYCWLRNAACRPNLLQLIAGSDSLLKFLIFEKQFF